MECGSLLPLCQAAACCGLGRGKPRPYKLCKNTARLDEPASAGLAEGLLGQPFTAGDNRNHTLSPL